MSSRRVKTPTILQSEAQECGAAALAMVLAYHGCWLPLETLRIQCGVSRDGSKAVNILKAARSFGLNARGMRLEPQALGSLTLPAILFVDMNHFVVLEGYEPDWVYLNDPATGRRKVSAADFDGMFSGIALVFEKGETFQKRGRPQRTLASVLNLARGSLPALLLILLLGVLLVTVSLFIPGFNRVFIDYVIIEAQRAWLPPLLIAMAAATAALGFATWVRAQLITRLNIKLGMVLGGELTWQVLRLPSSFFAQRHAGMVSARLPLADQIADLASQQLARFAAGLTTLVFFTALMLQYHLVLTLVCVLLGGANALVFAWLQRKLGESSESIALHSVKMNGRVMQGLQTIETLKATGADGVFFSQWNGLQALFVNAQQRVVHLQTLLGSLPILTAALTSAVVLTLGGLFVIDDELTVGMPVAFTFIVSSFTKPVEELMEIAGLLRAAQGPMAQINETLQLPVAREFDRCEATAQTERMPARLSGRVTLRDVSVGYAPLDPPLIRALDIELKPGSRVALVGGSGSGKSTIGRLISGMLEPSSGEVLFDGKPASHWPRQTLRSSLAVVDQNIVLFEGTLRENLTLWDDSMPSERVVQAAQDAMIHAEIMSRRGGYDGRVEEDGRNFSGGQRQRLEIARALAGNPSILILDEATSALDTVTEKAIMENLRKRGCTCIIIAHRLSTIRDCDEIIVLENGHVIERGTHEQLMDRKGVYHGLIEN